MTDTTPNNAISVRPSLNFNVENDRLLTFRNWTKPNTNPYELAKYGYYFTGHRDNVRCHFCGIEKSHWIIGDHPLIVHIQLNPGCPLLIRKSENKPNQPNFDEQLPPITSIVKSSSGKDIIKRTGNDVLHPDFRSYMSRNKSFKDWPLPMRPTAHELSDAGFFYLGKSDQVKCFCCGGIIENWDTNWNAWEQHAHRFEDCHYVQLCTSPSFIKEVRAKFSGLSKKPNSNIKNPENKATRQATSPKTCNICRNEKLNCIFIPCMHIYACVKCGLSIDECPICRHKISEIEKCFIV
jgi:hypothetical protein